MMRQLLSAIALSAVWLFAADVLAQGSDGMFVFVHGTVEDDALTAKTFNDLFRGTVGRWPDGGRVTLVLPPADSDGMKALCETLNVNERLYRRHLRELALRGEIQRPLEARSDADVIQFLRSTEGAIAPAGAAPSAESAALPVGVAILPVVEAP